ncbi:hypothetical protein TthAA37_06490 [Thermus thermophilus]|uniref:Putative zinc-finger domain-containing protein n=1 Tax=Thermus thermophilus TaxID=274 RepID=A0AAD1NXY7_THETH|nr:zf-HC2 domain-containing protein [Thermus thermophilus]BBL81831.1 hypothetical protein TthAA220_06150 [Thermus thermophilus]BBL84133.1 hypothetical protein TthAA229_06140 [Thermus thermophilus]BCZ86437.1 hypothetical protein TthAA11_06190 [Thermus thermophilus]BCZ88834.1 hypothetical protein TthAA22_06390 [Thermus thermophilus]BCZ91460.1 hypothetical protein TthAA37_06490 [Thermus thermophilus]
MEHVEALLPEYLAGNLDPQARVRVEAHLRACARCQEELRSLERAFFAPAEALPPVPPPEDAWKGIQARLRWVRKGRLWARITFLAAALVGAFLLGTYREQRAPEREALLETVIYWVSDPEAHWRYLQGDKERLGLLLWREDGHCLLLLREPPPPGRVYRLWGEARGSLHPLGQTRDRVLEADYRGFRTLVLSLEDPSLGRAPGRVLVRLTLP